MREKLAYIMGASEGFAAFIHVVCRNMLWVQSILGTFSPKQAALVRNSVVSAT